MNDERAVVQRCMGLGHAEFLRGLPPALGGLRWRWEDDMILVEDPPRLLLIRLGPERQQRLGALVLPQTPVTLSFQGYPEAERAAFLRRFDLAFQRGGG